MIKRIIFNILIFISAVSAPWWFTALFTIAVLYYFKNFNEIILFGVIMDVLYGRLSENFHWYDYRFTLFSLILLVSSHFIKKRLKFYNK